MVETKHTNRNLLLSILTVIGSMAVSLLVFYPSTSNLGEGFTVAIFYTISRYLFIGAGILVFLLRILRVVKKSSYWYIMPAVFNLFIGGLAIFLYFSGKAELSWLNACLINLLIGFVMMADTYLYSELVA
jgi:hypothetical protein